MIINALDATTMTHKSRYNTPLQNPLCEIRYHYTLTCEDVNAVDTCMSEVAPIHCNGDDLVWIKIS